ncbi:hypothetical protein LCGC14_1616550 [marine sediment metagenome]|uniref:Uncharacterized protein n=1 Tax=marine sediment metagenome TaxID=412755 RepID=A0A0F9L6P9_9ZZZZ
MAKEAEEKLYDVSGETGEQLVDSAHPGGGTRTELTHSKTDENLVETIVEQQKKDIEVAQSIPKGTYAALKDLHTKLEKLGVNKYHLNKLSGIIDSIYTPEEFISYRLAKLSDDLDAIGCYDAADKVDNFKKKAGIYEWWHNYPDAIGMVITRLEAIDITTNNRHLISRWKINLSELKVLLRRELPEDVAGKQQVAQQLQLGITKLIDMQKELDKGITDNIIVEWGQDDDEFRSAIQSATGVLQKQLSDLGQVAKQEVQRGIDFGGEGSTFELQYDDKSTVGKGEPKPKGSWRQRVVTDFATANRFSHWYNKIIGEAGEHETAIPVSDEARVSKTVTPQMKSGIEKALSRINEVGSGKEWAKEMRAGTEGGTEKPKSEYPADIRGAREAAKIKLEETVLDRLEEKDPRWKSERGSALIRRNVKEQDRYYDLSNPKAFQKALELILEKY